MPTQLVMSPETASRGHIAFFRGFPSNKTHADVAELVDALDLGSSAARRGGSSPLIRTRSLEVSSRVGQI